MLFFYIRHGDPIYSPDSLTPLGRRQAEALGRRLARYGLDKIFVSPLKRAQETAAPACELLKKDMTVLDWTSEGLAWGEFTSVDPAAGYRTWFFQNRSLQNLLVSAEMRALGADWFTHPIFAETKAAEGVARVRRETDALLASLGYVTALAACTSRSAPTASGSRCSRIRASEWPSSAACWTFPIRCSAAISTSIIRA